MIEVLPKDSQGVILGQFVSENYFVKWRIDLAETDNMYENSIISFEYHGATFGRPFRARRATKMAFAPRSRDSCDSTISKQAFTKPMADAIHKFSPPKST